MERELRELRQSMLKIEAKLESLASENNMNLVDVVEQFNDIYHEFTSSYHEPNRLVLGVID